MPNLSAQCSFDPYLCHAPFWEEGFRIEFEDQEILLEYYQDVVEL